MSVAAGFHKPKKIKHRSEQRGGGVKVVPELAGANFHKDYLVRRVFFGHSEVL